MNNSLRVGVLHRLREREDQFGRRARGPRLALNPLRERVPLDIFHHQVRSPVVLADLVQLADVRMLEPRDGLGLGAEPLPRFARGLARQLDHLDRHVPPQGRLARQVDDPHAAQTQLADNVETRDFRRRRTTRFATSIKRYVRLGRGGTMQKLIELPQHLDLALQRLGQLGTLAAQDLDAHPFAGRLELLPLQQ